VRIIDRYFQDLGDKDDDDQKIRSSLFYYFLYLVLLCLCAFIFCSAGNIFALPLYLFSYYYLGGELGKHLIATHENIKQKKKRELELRTKHLETKKIASQLYRANTQSQINRNLEFYGNNFSLSQVNFDREYELAQIEAIENLK